MSETTNMDSPDSGNYQAMRSSSRFSRKKSVAENQRAIYLNQVQPKKYCKNKISTAKYSFLTFFPKFLFEQFRKYANVFFLCISLLQQIPNLSPTGRYTTAIPLVIILTVSAIKEIIEDVKRHRADDSTNNSKTHVLVNGQWEERLWKELQVGDVLRIENGEGIPADVVLLASSEPQAMCYIETSNLDGETNLKLRQGIPATAQLTCCHELSRLRATVNCESPHKDLYSFLGNIEMPAGGDVTVQPHPVAGTAAETGDDATPPTVKHALNTDQLLLRGSSLRNTKWVSGVIVYSGDDTKVRLNSTSPPLKRSSVETETNQYIIVLFLVLVCLALVTSIANIVWTNVFQGDAWYLSLNLSEPGANVHLLRLRDFFTYLVLYNTIIPISLPVTLEVVRTIQAFFMNWDIDMYDPVSDTPSSARTSNLNEDLGKVKYIFSDKTGTLTRNVMEFKACSIAGECYVGDSTDPETQTAVKDEALLAQIASSDGSADNPVDEFMFALAVCHTVVPEQAQEGGHIEYQASSPDESALVKAAAQLGYVFTTRNPQSVVVQHKGERVQYDVLHVIEFTSARKRMSVVVRDPRGRIQLLCKGADSVIYERLAEASPHRHVTLQHLEQFAKSGLRTLCIAARPHISQSEYEVWRTEFEAASTAVVDRERLVAACAERIERDLELVGATAIEDKLQLGVPDTIFKLAQAGIRIWMLTGDKQETAINIGFSCQLLQPDMRLFTLNSDSLDETRAQLTEAVNVLKPCAASAAFGLHYQHHAEQDAVMECNGEETGWAGSGRGARAMRFLRRVLPDCCFSSRCVAGGGGARGSSRDKVALMQHRHSRHGVEFAASSGGAGDAYEERDANSSSAEEESSSKQHFALVIDGAGLKHALEPALRDMFLHFTLNCKAVICCRVSPSQKADIVRLIKSNLDRTITLAIGDGANDVSMIQAAHVGIGISGMEGLQAACASDYAIAQFRFLQKLLLVHGSWNYSRLTKCILYSFYKNLCLYSCQFWFSFMSGFSGQILFERWSMALYNVLFTAAPPVVLGLWDRSCSVENCLKYPQLYKDNQTSSKFNLRIFLYWIFNSVFHSAILFWLPMLCLSHDAIYSNGTTGSLLVLGNSVYSLVVVTVCLKAGLEHHAWTLFSHLAIWGSIAAWFLFLIVYSFAWRLLRFAPTFNMMFQAVFSSGLFWLLLALIPPLALTRDVSWKAWKRTLRQTLREEIMLAEKTHTDPDKIMRKNKMDNAKQRIRQVFTWNRGAQSEALSNENAAAAAAGSSSANAAGMGGEFNGAAPVPSERDQLSGFAFSQEESGAVSQSVLIRRYDSERQKPSGN